MWPQQPASGNEKRSETQQHFYIYKPLDYTRRAAGVISRPALTSKQTDDLATKDEWVTWADKTECGGWGVWIVCKKAAVSLTQTEK